MAASHVSGGIALLADYFDGQLCNTEILQRLFATANKTRIYADSEIYGQGLSDLNEDPDLGDSSRFTRRSKIRSTWSAGRNTPAHNTVADDANKKELKLFQKIGKLFTGK